MPVKPEDVGLSSSRLARIGDHMKRYIDAGKIAGTLTLWPGEGRWPIWSRRGISRSSGAGP